VVLWTMLYTGNARIVCNYGAIFMVSMVLFFGSLFRGHFLRVLIHLSTRMVDVHIDTLARCKAPSFCKQEAGGPDEKSFSTHSQSKPDGHIRVIRGWG